MEGAARCAMAFTLAALAALAGYAQAQLGPASDDPTALLQTLRPSVYARGEAANRGAWRLAQAEDGRIRYLGAPGGWVFGAPGAAAAPEASARGFLKSPARLFGGSDDHTPDPGRAADLRRDFRPLQHGVAGGDRPSTGKRDQDPAGDVSAEPHDPEDPDPPCGGRDGDHRPVDHRKDCRTTAADAARSLRRPRGVDFAVPYPGMLDAPRARRDRLAGGPDLPERPVP